MKIVSLIASATEIVCALGLQDQLVGRSHECDFPPSVKLLPQCSRPKFPDASSQEIDRDVRQLVEQGLSVYNIDADLLARLSPDAIITQDQCEVCAVSLADVERALGELVGEGSLEGNSPVLVSLKPFSLEDVFSDIERVAVALKVPQRGVELVQNLRSRMTNLAVKSFRAKTIVCLEWLDPLMASGYWAPQLVQMAGAHDVLGAPRAHAPWIDFEQLRQADPEAILAMPCGFDLERGCQELQTVMSAPGWNELRAVRTGQLFVADGNAYFNRPGPRLVESLEILTQILWSGDARGTGWVRLS